MVGCETGALGSRGSRGSRRRSIQPLSSLGRWAVRSVSLRGTLVNSGTRFTALSHSSIVKSRSCSQYGRYILYLQISPCLDVVTLLSPLPTNTVVQNRTPHFLIIVALYCSVFSVTSDYALWMYESGEELLHPEEILCRFKKVFGREMTAAERSGFFLPTSPEKEDEDEGK